MTATPAPASSTRAVVALALGVFLVGWGTNVSTPFLVLYRDRLELGDSATMAIFTVYVVGILGTLPIAGPLSDRFGRRVVVVPFVALSGLASLVMVLGRDELVYLLLGRFLLGVVSGAVFGVSAAWLQELLGPGHEQRAAVMSTLITYGGFGIGPPISAAFEAWLPQPLVLPFVVHAAATFAAVPFLLTVPETHRDRPIRIRIEFGVPQGSQRLFWVVVVPAAIWVFSFPSTSFALFPVLLEDAVPDAEVLVAAISGMLTAWAGLLARPILQRIAPRPALLVGMALGATGYVLGTVAFASDVWPLVLPAAVCLGCASGTLTAGALGVLGEMAEPHTRGALNSTFYLLAYPGMAMPIVVTTIGGAIGTTGALVAITGTVVAVLGASTIRYRHDVAGAARVTSAHG